MTNLVEEKIKQHIEVFKERFETYPEQFKKIYNNDFYDFWRKIYGYDAKEFEIREKQI